MLHLFQFKRSSIQNNFIINYLRSVWTQTERSSSLWKISLYILSKDLHSLILEFQQLLCLLGATLAAFSYENQPLSIIICCMPVYIVY